MKDSRLNVSDFHEYFKVEEIFNNSELFEAVLDNVNIESDNSSEDSEEEDEEPVLSMELVRFSSLPILPSYLESLQNEAKHEVKQVTIHDFELVKVISHGAYGKVILSCKKNTRDPFAIKVLDKEKMKDKNVTQYVMNERDILNSLDNDFIVKGVYTFQSDRFLYMVMEFMKGGDLANLLENVGMLDEESASYYLA